MNQKLCLITDYQRVTRAGWEVWKDLDRHLAEQGCRLAVLTPFPPDSALPFPVIRIPLPLPEFARDFPVAVQQGGNISPRDLALLEVDSARSQGGYSASEASTGLLASRQVFRTLLKTLQPGCVFTWDSTSPLAAILRGLCEEAGVPVRAIERGFLPETLMIENRGFYGESDLLTNWLAQELPTGDPSAFERIRAYYLQHKPQKYDQPDFGQGGPELRRSLGLGNQKVVVFFGHFDPCGLVPADGNLRRHHSPVFSSTRDALAALAEIAAGHPELALVFKPHPIDGADYTVAAGKGVHIVRDVNVHALIDLADVVAASFTTLQYEAQLYDKPILALSRSVWWGRNAVYEVNRREGLGPVLMSALDRQDWRVRSANARAFLAWAMDQFLIGYHDQVPTRHGLRDLARFIVRTSLDAHDLPPLEERWLRAQAELGELRLHPIENVTAPSIKNATNSGVPVPDFVSGPIPSPLINGNQNEKKPTTMNSMLAPKMSTGTKRAPARHAIPSPWLVPALGAPEPDTRGAEQLLRQAEHHFARNDPGSARAFLLEALQKSPENPDVLDALGNIEWSLGHLTEAKDLFVELTRVCPAHAEGYLKVSAIALQLDETDHADAALQMARRHEPTSVQVLSASGNFYLRQNLFLAALKDFQAVLEKTPENLEALLAVCKCQFKLGKLDQAHAACLQVLRLDPGNSVARESLMIIETARRDQTHPARSTSPFTQSNAQPFQTSPPVAPSPAAPQPVRSLPFAQNPHRRFFWHKRPHSDFIPPVYSFLNDEEWGIIESWFADTERLSFIGESTIPFMSQLQALIMGNRLRRVVQLGTYSGYSSLLMGFMLRRMGMKSALYSVDVDKMTTDFAESYVKRAGLEEQVKLVLCDSTDPSLPGRAVEYFGGGRPQLVIIDSSHQKDQTTVELDHWYDALVPGGFMILHDSSGYARKWDSTGKGGVQAAFEEWMQKNPDIPCLNIDCAASVDPESPHFVYQDGNGVGMVYKRKDRV